MTRKKKNPFIDAARGSLTFALVYLWQNDAEFRTIILELLKSLKKNPETERSPE